MAKKIVEIDINRSHNFFLCRFLSKDIGNRNSSMIDIDYYRLSFYRLTGYQQLPTLLDVTCCVRLHTVTLLRVVGGCLASHTDVRDTFLPHVRVGCLYTRLLSKT